MIQIKDPPDGKAEIIARYGNPDADGDMVLDAKWYADNLIVGNLPWPMRLSWTGETIKRVQAHRLVMDSLMDALYEVGKKFGLYEAGSGIGMDEVRRRNWDMWGGCFNFRRMRQYPALSVHSWGAAVDICPAIGRQGHREDIATFPQAYVNAFRSRGWDWGGAWGEQWLADAQHFQACTGY